MRLTYDKKGDAVYITLKGHGVGRTERIGPDIPVDYGADGEIDGLRQERVKAKKEEKSR